MSGAILAVIIFISDYSYIRQTPAEHYKFKRSAGWRSYFHAVEQGIIFIAARQQTAPAANQST